MVKWENLIQNFLFGFIFIFILDFAICDDDGATKSPPAYFMMPEYEPFPRYDPSNLAPEFPLTHTYVNGVYSNLGQNTLGMGSFNVPLVNRNRMFDWRGRIEYRNQDTEIEYGHVISPVNSLKLPMRELEQTMHSPDFRAATAKNERRPIVNLPDGYVPFVCKPPYCNPYVHNLGLAQNVNGDTTLLGSMDFPIFAKKPGEPDYRFPMDGMINPGNSENSIFYGHVIPNVDPFRRYYPKDQQRFGSEARPFLPFPFRPSQRS